MTNKRSLLSKAIAVVRRELHPKFSSAFANLSIQERQALIQELSAPRPLMIKGSQLCFHVQSVTEDARVRKFKEPWTISWLRALPPGAVLYDVGANIGITALIAAESGGPTLRVVAIEPFPANFDSLVKNIQTNKLGDRIVPLSIGLGRETAIVPFNWASGEPGGSLHSFGEIVVLSHGEQKRPIGYHWCLSYRLDDLVGLPGAHFPTHIKIDVDGSEIDVLDGGRKVLADPRCRAIQVEVVDPDISRSRSAEVCELMAQAGMTLSAEHAHSTSYPLVTDLQFIKR